MTAATRHGAEANAGSEAAIAEAVAAHLARHRARLAQVICGPETDWVATLRRALRYLPEQRLILIVCGGLDLPAEFALVQIIRVARATSRHGISACDLAAALDRLPSIDAALLVLLFPEPTAQLCGSGAEAAALGQPLHRLLPELAAAWCEAACGSGAAG